MTNSLKIKQIKVKVEALFSKKQNRKKKNCLLNQKDQYAPKRLCRKSEGKKIIEEIRTEEHKCPNRKGPLDPTTAMTATMTRVCIDNPQH